MAPGRPIRSRAASDRRIGPRRFVLAVALQSPGAIAEAAGALWRQTELLGRRFVRDEADPWTPDPADWDVTSRSSGRGGSGGEGRSPAARCLIAQRSPPTSGAPCRGPSGERLTAGREGRRLVAGELQDVEDLARDRVHDLD
jgi:hypothetical protein